MASATIPGEGLAELYGKLGEAHAALREHGKKIEGLEVELASQREIHERVLKNKNQYISALQERRRDASSRLADVLGKSHNDYSLMGIANLAAQKIEEQAAEINRLRNRDAVTINDPSATAAHRVINEHLGRSANSPSIFTLDRRVSMLIDDLKKEKEKANNFALDLKEARDKIAKMEQERAEGLEYRIYMNAVNDSHAELDKIRRETWSLPHRVGQLVKKYKAANEYLDALGIEPSSDLKERIKSFYDLRRADTHMLTGIVEDKGKIIYRLNSQVAESQQLLLDTQNAASTLQAENETLKAQNRQHAIRLFEFGRHGSIRAKPFVDDSTDGYEWWERWARDTGYLNDWDYDTDRLHADAGYTDEEVNDIKMEDTPQSVKED